MPHRNFLDYFEQIDTLLESYPDAYAEQYNATILSDQRANLKLRLRFYFKYLLSISEALVIVDDQIKAIDYRYHFQDEQNNLIFRYDNTPHFPDLSSFPHHKHLPNQVIVSEQPNIAIALQDVTDFLASVSFHKLT
jgi:hypothetical protein